MAALTIASGLVLTGVKLAAGTTDGASASGGLVFLPPAVTFSIVGLMVALRRPDNPAGWLMLVIGALWSVLGVQLIGARLREDLLLDAAQAVEDRAPVLTPIQPRVAVPA